MADQQTGDPEICSVCEQHPDDILMLQCAHDLCVTCASEIYAKAHGSGSAKKQPLMFTCEICLTQTVLDKESVQCLEAAIAQMKKKTHHPVLASVSAPNPLPPVPPRYRSTQGQCTEHKEPLLYFCFDCRTTQICAECILTDRHRSHQVCTFKKATSQIMKQLEVDVKERELARTKITNDKKKLVEGQVMFRSQVESRKKELKLFFDEVVSLASSQYQRLLQELDDVVQTSEASIRGQMDVIEARLTDTNQEIQKLHQTLKEPEKALLHKFAKRQLQESRQQEWRLQPAANYVSIEYPQQDIVEQLTRLLQKMCVHVQRNLSASGYGFSNRIRTEGLAPTHEHLSEPEKVVNTDNKRPMKRSPAEMTPAKPQLKHSLDLASNIISKLQTRQKKFE